MKIYQRNSFFLLNFFLILLILSRLARFYLCVPLPPYWTKQFNAEINQETYSYGPDNIEIPLHPSYMYFCDQVKFLRDYFKKRMYEEAPYVKKMFFQDHLNRTYELDMVNLINEKELNKDKRGQQKMDLEDRGDENANAKQEKEEDLTSKLYTIYKRLNIVMIKINKIFFQLTTKEINDRLLIQVALQAGLSLQTELHLLSNFESLEFLCI
jgi:hypothetical protein